MIQHVVETLEPVVDEVIVVRSAELTLPSLAAEVKVVVDREAARGPLAGIRDGLAATDAASAFVTSTDAPFLTSAYVNALFAFSGGAACAPVEDGFVQVLSAIYPGSAGAEAQALLDADMGRPRALLESLSYRVFEWPADEIAHNAWDGFNTPEAYLALVREIDPEASATFSLEVEGSGARVRVPVGTLGEVLENAAKALGGSSRSWRSGEQVAEPFCVRLGEASGESNVRSLAVPVGPDEIVTLATMDEAL
jgi:molybdopterin-guanine dinucleotide biosynthesis protein A